LRCGGVNPKIFPVGRGEPKDVEKGVRIKIWIGRLGEVLIYRVPNLVASAVVGLTT